MTILLDVGQLALESKSSLEINLLYIVDGASWAASYDIRVNQAAQHANLTYYGEVLNTTGRINPICYYTWTTDMETRGRLGRRESFFKHCQTVSCWFSADLTFNARSL